MVRLSFTDINPFIRHSHRFTIEKSNPYIDVKAYDYRLIYVIKGNGFLKLDNQMIPVKVGSLLFWPPGITYSFLPNTNDRFHLYGVNFDFTRNHASSTTPIIPDKSDAFKDSNIVELAEFNDQPMFNRYFKAENMQKAETILSQIDQEYNAKKIFWEGKACGWITLLLFELVRSLSSTDVDFEKGNHTIDDIIGFMQENYDQPLNNEMLGARFNFHPNYLNRIFVKNTGYSLRQYLIRYRINAAFNLLQTTDMSITDISLKVGFSDINYFSRCFKKILGVRPRECQIK